MKCIKDLYKSTYKGMAFVAGKEYKVAAQNAFLIFVIDEEKNHFSFSARKGDATMYVVFDYFDMV